VLSLSVTTGGDATAASIGDTGPADDGIAHRIAQRAANERKSAAANPPTNAQGLVEFRCECNKADCERVLHVPHEVYRRMVDLDQYLLQAGHHAFTTYRTIVSVGLMRIEESA
jgi:hypothetical protein